MGTPNQNTITITPEQFESYVEIQEMGAYNMFDPRARELTDMTKAEWVYIMKNYSELKDRAEGVDIASCL